MRIPLLPDDSARPKSNGNEILPDYSSGETRAALPEKKEVVVPEDSGYGAGIGQAE
jgi:hypothetical protein